MSGSDHIKVHEFVAHESEVTCISIGHVSNQVLATGGEDKKVNVWRVGRSANIRSLGGNNTAITALCFDTNEQAIVSGSQGGSLKLYDLGEGKLARKLNGHMTNITSVDYHPYGDFIASGSADTNMKVWDVRNKACLQTYKGHSGEITHVEFSPDGQWVASSATDGLLKIWDITAGKIKHTFKLSSSSISTFAFNPCEFLLAAVTSDRVVKFWDLEHFELIGSSPAENNAIKTISFNHDGSTLLTASQDGIKEHTLDPPSIARYMPVQGWGQVEVNCLMPLKRGTQVLGGSFFQNFVSVWAIELEGLYEYRAAEDEYDPQRAIRQREMKQQAESKRQSDQVKALLQDPLYQKEEELSIMGQGMVGVPAISTAKPKNKRRTSTSDTPLSARGHRRTSTSRGGSSNHHQASSVSLPERDRATSAGRRRRENSNSGSVVAGTPKKLADPSPRVKSSGTRKPPLRSMSTGRLGTSDGNAITPRPASDCAVSRPQSNDTRPGSRPSSNDRSALRNIGQAIIGGGNEAPLQLQAVREQAQVEFSASGIHSKVYPDNTPSKGAAESPFQDELERFSKSGDYNFQGAKGDIDRGAEQRAYEEEQQREIIRQRELRAMAAEARVAPRQEHVSASQAHGAPRQEYVPQSQAHGTPRQEFVPPSREPIHDNYMPQPVAHEAPARDYPPRSQAELHAPPAQNYAPRSARQELVAPANHPQQQLDHYPNPSHVHAPAQPPSLRHNGSDVSLRQQPSASSGETSPGSFAPVAPAPAASTFSDNDIMSELLLHRTTITLALSSRLSQIEILKSRWQAGDWNGVVVQLEQISLANTGKEKSDFTTICDFLRSVDLRFEALNLDSCIKLFPIILRIFPSGFESHINTALKICVTLIEMFGEYVCNTRYAPRHGAVDISREERIEKCDRCYEHMKQLRNEVSNVMQRISKFDRAWEIEASCKKLEDFFSNNMLDM